jgi:Bacterial extracellular solute-binding protein
MPAHPQHAVPARHGGSMRRKAIVIGVTLALASGGVLVTQAVRAADGCDGGGPALEVAASPDIAAAVSRIARAPHDPQVCPEIRVRAEREPDVLTALRHPVVRPPDVWIPDSSLWVERARSEHVADPRVQQSIASSPLVLTVSRATRDSLARGEAALQWQDLIGAVSAGQLALHVPGEAASASTAGVLVALKAAADRQPDPRAALTELLRGTRADPGLGEGSQALAALGSSPDAPVPVAEQTVFQHHGAPQVAAVHVGGTGTPFDFPFTVLRPEGALPAAAGRLLGELRAADGQTWLRRNGFRGVDGAGTGLAAGRGVDAAEPGDVAVPSVGMTEDLLHTLSAVQRDARVLAVVDVSGSMAAPVPGSNGSSRLDVALRSAAAGLELYPSTTEVGVWSFSEDVSGSTDHRELVPVAPLGGVAPGGRRALALAMTQLRPVPGGGTGLYDTTLAAVRAARTSCSPRCAASRRRERRCR